MQVVEGGCPDSAETPHPQLTSSSLPRVKTREGDYIVEEFDIEIYIESKIRILNNESLVSPRDVRSKRLRTPLKKKDLLRRGGKRMMYANLTRRDSRRSTR